MKLDINLIGTNMKLVEEWKIEFRHLSGVQITSGSIFDERADAIVSPANSFGNMDGGLDGKLRDFFGMQLEESVKKKIKFDYYGELPVGAAIVVETNHDQFKYLISAPTMRVPEDVSDSLNAYIAMRAILKAGIEHGGINSIAIPGLCSLSGRMPLNIVARQMRVAYERIVLNKIRYSHWREERELQQYLRCMTNQLPYDLEKKWDN